MSFRVLHIMDCYLPETMNWLDKLLHISSDACIHFVSASFIVSTHHSRVNSIVDGIQSIYPVPWYNKLINKFTLKTRQGKLEKEILSNQINILHFHFGNVAIQHLNWIERSPLPICVSLYGYDYEYLIYKNPKYLDALRKLASLKATFIVEGQFSKSLLIEYGIPGYQIHILHMLFQCGAPPPSIKYLQPIRLFQAATFTEKKNQLALLEALQDRHRSRFVIQMNGEISDHVYYKELIKVLKSKSSHHIEIGGLLPFNEYIHVLKQHHFSTNLSKRSSKNDTEGGCPVFLKDSLSLGKPVISTRHCDIPELVINGFNGWLLEENDIKEVTNLLDQLLLLSEQEYRQLCMNARHGVEMNLMQNLTKSELINIYKNLQ